MIYKLIVSEYKNRNSYLREITYLSCFSAYLMWGYLSAPTHLSPDLHDCTFTWLHKYEIKKNQF